MYELLVIASKYLARQEKKAIKRNIGFSWVNGSPLYQPDDRRNIEH